jgi:hypothetical protein
MQLRWGLLMLITQHVSGIIMPIIRSTRRDDKPHMVFCTGRAVVDLRRWGGCRVHLHPLSAHGIYPISSSPLLHDQCRTPYTVCRPLLYSLWWAQWCLKHVEWLTSINFNLVSFSWFFLLLYIELDLVLHKIIRGIVLIKSLKVVIKSIDTKNFNIY